MPVNRIVLFGVIVINKGYHWFYFITNPVFSLFLFLFHRPHHGTASQRVLTTTLWEDTEEKKRKESFYLTENSLTKDIFFSARAPVIVLLFSLHAKDMVGFVTDLLVSLFHVLCFFCFSPPSPLLLWMKTLKIVNTGYEFVFKEYIFWELNKCHYSHLSFETFLLFLLLLESCPSSLKKKAERSLTCKKKFNLDVNFTF